MQNPSIRQPRLHSIALALLATGAGSAALAQTAAPAAGEAAALPQVTVRSKYEREDLPVRAPGHKAASGARLGILGATSIMEAPVHVNAYTRELAEDWSALTLQDVLENDAAVVFTTNKNHLLQNFNLRGLDMNAMDIATNGLYGIAPANSVPIEMFERVEVLRGPNVLLSGMPPGTSVAGTVNMVTKRALAKPIAELTFTYGSHSYGQVHADLGKRFGAEQRLGVRFNGVYGTGKMGAKDEKQTRSVGALGIDYLATAPASRWMCTTASTRSATAAPACSTSRATPPFLGWASCSARRAATPTCSAARTASTTTPACWRAASSTSAKTGKATWPLARARRKAAG